VFSTATNRAWNEPSEIESGMTLWRIAARKSYSCFSSYRLSEGSCPTLQARRSKKRRVLRYPSSGPVSCPQLRTATAKTLPKGLRPLAPARGFPSLPHCAALRLCRPRGFPLSLRFVASPGRFPSPCSCYPRRRGPGPRRCCVNNNSKTIQTRKDKIK
jgi:hypothetical protein